MVTVVFAGANVVNGRVEGDGFAHRVQVAVDAQWFVVPGQVGVEKRRLGHPWRRRNVAVLVIPQRWRFCSGFTCRGAKTDDKVTMMHYIHQPCWAASGMTIAFTLRRWVGTGIVNPRGDVLEQIGPQRPRSYGNALLLAFVPRAVRIA